MPSVPEATTNNDQQPFPSTSHPQYSLHLHATSCPKWQISKMSPIKTLRAQSVSSIAGPTASSVHCSLLKFTNLWKNTIQTNNYRNYWLRNSIHFS